MLLQDQFDFTASVVELEGGRFILDQVYHNKEKHGSWGLEQLVHVTVVSTVRRKGRLILTFSLLSPFPPVPSSIHGM